MTNQRRILSIHSFYWYELMRNEEVDRQALRVAIINDLISRRRHALVGVARQTLHLSVTTWQGCWQRGTVRRPRGRPRKCWVEQSITNTGLSLPDAWSAADGSVGATTRRRPSVHWERGKKRIGGEGREMERERECCKLSCISLTPRYESLTNHISAHFNS